VEVNDGPGAEATMSAAGSCTYAGDIETFVFDESIINSMMFIAG
jgi:hypothetical protein